MDSLDSYLPIDMNVYSILCSDSVKSSDFWNRKGTRFIPVNLPSKHPTLVITKSIISI